MNEKRFNDLLKIFGVALLVMSFIETKNLLQYMIGYSSFEEKLYVWIGSLLVNGVETVCFIFWYKNRKQKFYTAWFAFLLGVCFGLISVIGSLGWFQTKQELNVLSSKEYQQLETSIQRHDDQAQSWRDGSSNEAITAWANVKAEKEQAKADSLRTVLASVSLKGAGVGNALYRMFGKLGQVDTYTAAAVSGMTFSGLKEIAAIFLLILGMFSSKSVNGEQVNVQLVNDAENGERSVVNVQQKRSFSRSRERISAVSKVNFDDPVTKEIVHLLKSTELSYKEIGERVGRAKSWVSTVNKAAGGIR